MVNENLYEKLEHEVSKLSSKFDMKALREKHRELSKDLGECYISCNDVFEAMEAGDAFGIGMAVERPEAAIADPSRLIIKDIVPTYATSDSFLESAQFKLQ